MKKKKSWIDKLSDKKDLPKVVICGKKDKYGPGWGLKAGDTFVIPAPREVDEVMKAVRRVNLITMNEIRNVLAKKHKTTSACPITTGIFGWIAANAAEEEKSRGIKKITPYWRTLKTGGEINAKYPGGVDAQRKYLEAEGQRVVEKGKKTVVEDYEKYIMKL
jgi:hypothetical protein